MIQITVDPRQIIGEINAIHARHLPYALARALTLTAKAAQARATQQLPRGFDKPTPYTMRSIRIIPAKSKAQVISTTVFVQDEASKGTSPGKYLEPGIEGGSRRVKRFERQMQWSGMMPKGAFAVPTSFAPLDRYGNLPAAYLVRMLSILRSWGQQGYRANETDAGEKRRKKREKRSGTFPTDFFAAGARSVTRNHGPQSGRGYLPPGVYQRKESRWGSAIRPILLFVNGVHYNKRYAFAGIVEDVHQKLTAEHIRAAWAEAMRTAR